MELRERLAAVNEDMLFADGFDEALIGMAQSAGKATVALYDMDLCVTILEERDGMDAEEALEYLYFNVVNSYMGENTPMFATMFPKEIHGKQEGN